MLQVKKAVWVTGRGIRNVCKICAQPIINRLRSATFHKDCHRMYRDIQTQYLRGRKPDIITYQIHLRSLRKLMAKKNILAIPYDANL